jgi:hypothetical protein
VVVLPPVLDVYAAGARKSRQVSHCRTQRQLGTPDSIFNPSILATRTQYMDRIVREAIEIELHRYNINRDSASRGSLSSAPSRILLNKTPDLQGYTGQCMLRAVTPRLPVQYSPSSLGFLLSPTTFSTCLPSSLIHQYHCHFSIMVPTFLISFDFQYEYLKLMYYRGVMFVQLSACLFFCFHWGVLYQTLVHYYSKGLERTLREVSEFSWIIQYTTVSMFSTGKSVSH